MIKLYHAPLSRSEKRALAGDYLLGPEFSGADIMVGYTRNVSRGGPPSARP